MKIITYETENGKISDEYKNSLLHVLTEAKSQLQVEYVEADKDLKRKLDEWNGSENLLTLFAEHVGDTSDKRMLISATNSEIFKIYCTRETGHAAWGCCLGGEVIAIEYAPSAATISTQLHETLHLFGIDDCYEDNTKLPKRTCTKESCVMLYGVNSVEVCSNVVKQLNG